MAVRSGRSTLPAALAVAGGAALVLLAAAPGAFAAPTARPAADSGSAEVGYAAAGGKYTSVAASWVQPTVACGSTSTADAFWAGLDGFGSDTVEQTGTQVDCSGGTAAYSGFYDLYPSFPVTYTQPVAPGDAMSASVSTDGQGTFTLTLTDATQGWTRTTTKALSGAALASAEVVAQVPAGTASSSTGHSVAFTGSTVNGAALDKSGPEQLTAPGTTVSPITGGGDFTVTWGAA